MANTNKSETLESLAADIGDRIYIDLAKWHLYLNDARLNNLLAEKFYPLLETDSVTEAAVDKILGEIPVELGGGKTQLPLIGLIPTQCQVELMELLEEYQKDI
jgi:hypothetical protein